MSEGTQRRLAAIVSADVVGYSRLMGVDEASTLAALRSHRAELIDGKIAEHGGRIVKTMGDGLLLEFPSVVDATQCVIDVQQAMVGRNEAVDEDKRIVFRIGVHLGDLVVEGDDIFGDGINIAARLEAICEAGGVAISGTAHENVAGRIEAGFADAGEQQLKNISRPVRVWQWMPTTAADKVTAETPLPLPDKPSIAVLPFDNMSGDPDQEYFADGITEDIITALSRLRWFLVIARNSTFVYKGRSVDVTEVGRELGVRYVLEGSVRKIGNRVRIAAQLVDATTGAHHWAQNFDRDLDDIFELQDDITQSVTAAIEPKLVAAEGARSRSRSPQNLSAWELVAHAMDHYGRMTTSKSETAIKLLRSAVQSYPDYGPAHSLLAFTLLMSGHMGWIPDGDDYNEAAELARRAAELDNEDPWAHVALGYLAFTNRRTDEAVRAYKKALELNPNFTTAHGFLGWALAFDGQSDEAIPYIEMALRLSPHDPMKAQFYGCMNVAHYQACRYDEAVEWSRKATMERPDNMGVWRLLCASLAQAGRTEEVKEAMVSLRKLQPNLSIAWIEQHVPYTERAMPHYIEGMRKAGLT
jgi:TolB-like protein/class 3 adenylate cyclase